MLTTPCKGRFNAMRKRKSRLRVWGIYFEAFNVNGCSVQKHNNEGARVDTADLIAISTIINFAGAKSTALPWLAVYIAQVCHLG